MDVKTFVNKAKEIATKYKTLYVMGCFGAPMNDANKKRYINHHTYNQKPQRMQMIRNATADTFGFDCVCLIKGILWGWSGNVNDIYGGAKYGSNSVPDMSADGFFSYCQNKSTDFTSIQVGAAVWMSGHIGIYVGDGLVVECTPSFANKVQLTALGNVGNKTGYPSRRWSKWGLIPWVNYKAGSASTEEKPVDKKKTVTEIAREVIAGKWGVYPERKERLEKAGYNYKSVQATVNKLMKGDK